MNDAIINGIFTLSGVVIGGIISYFVARDKKEVTALNRQISELKEKNDSLKNTIIKLCNQVSSYWNTEKLYSEELAKLKNKKVRTILNKKRDEVEGQGIERPSLTANDVSKILEKL